MAAEAKESTGRWLVGVLLAVGAIVATLVASDKIHLPRSTPPPPTSSVVDTSLHLVLQPASGKVGDTITVRVTGFGPQEVVTVRFAEVNLASLTTDAAGAAESPVTIPSGATGSTTVTARGGQSGRTTTAQFQVLGQ